MIFRGNEADGGHAHQPPRPGQPQFLYVRISNRGTAAATGVNVKALQGAADNENWPAGWTSLTSPVSVPGSLPSGGQTIVGPIAWVPASAHTRVLVSVSASGDPSNIDTVAGALPLGRLVSTDNNLAIKTM